MDGRCSPEWICWYSRASWSRSSARPAPASHRGSGCSPPGGLRPDSGTVYYDGYDVHDEFTAVRSRIGLVPQDDLVHRLLTPRQALNYSAMLRLPGDTTRPERWVIVDVDASAELSMSEHTDTRTLAAVLVGRESGCLLLSNCSPPRRCCCSTSRPRAWTRPWTAELMTSLRGLADAGRAVVVVTHNVAELGQCNTVIVLAPGGVPVYSGPPTRLVDRFGTSDWADVFAMVAAEPQPVPGGEPTRRTTGQRSRDRQAGRTGGHPSDGGAAGACALPAAREVDPRRPWVRVLPRRIADTARCARAGRAGRRRVAQRRRHRRRRGEPDPRTRLRRGGVHGRCGRRWRGRRRAGHRVARARRRSAAVLLCRGEGSGVRGVVQRRSGGVARRRAW